MIQISKGQIKTGKLVQRTDYYASGEPWLEPTYGNGTGENRYLFGGKERLAGGALNEYDFEARNYVASLPRFTTIDPEAEKFPWLSPYAYCNANPINFIDPTGEDPTDEEAARMAAHIYGDKKDEILIGGWSKTPDNLGLKLNNSDGLKSAVYVRTDAEGNALEYAYVTAGTEKEWDDIKADILQPFGLSQQYSNAVDNAKKIVSHINDLNISDLILTFIGHSMGAAEAALNALVTDRKAITFNPAGVSDITKIKEGSWFTPFKSENKIDAYIMRTDPLNILQDRLPIPKANGIRHYLSPTDLPSVYNGHSIDNVLKSFGVNPDKYKKK